MRIIFRTLSLAALLLWWPAARMVMVADVHFGKAATFRRAGQPVPHGTTADNLARLDALLAATGADHLVFLGDFLHARSGAAGAERHLLHCGAMFIPSAFIAGHGSRGAWPWRKPVPLNP